MLASPSPYTTLPLPTPPSLSLQPLPLQTPPHSPSSLAPPPQHPPHRFSPHISPRLFLCLEFTPFRWSNPDTVFIVRLLHVTNAHKMFMETVLAKKNSYNKGICIHRLDLLIVFLRVPWIEAKRGRGEALLSTIIYGIMNN